MSDQYREEMECECDHCHRVVVCTYASDPFIAEVNDEKTEPSRWCDDCYSTRHDEV